MNETTDIPLIEKTLSDVEAAVTAAHPLGEHARWIGDVRKSLNSLGYVTKGEMLPRHKKEFERIIAEDIVLTPRIDQLREHDAQLVSVANQLLSDAEQMLKNLENSDLKAESEQQVEQLVTKSIELDPQPVNNVSPRG